MKCFVCTILVLKLFIFQSFCQCLTPQQLLSDLVRIEQDTSDILLKLFNARLLKKSIDACNVQKDSAYARLLHKIGLWEFYGEKNFPGAILNSKESVKINLGRGQNLSPSFAVNTYNNLGIFYQSYYMYKEALIAYDSCISLAKRVGGNQKYVVQAIWSKSHINFILGDYEQSIDDASRGILKFDNFENNILLLKLYITRAQSFAYSKSIDNASADLLKAELILKKEAESSELLSDYYSAAVSVAEERKQYDKVINYYNRIINLCLAIGDSSKLADAYSDLGVFYRLKLKRYDLAERFYNKALFIAETCGNIFSKAATCTNLSELNIEKTQAYKSAYFAQKGLCTFIPAFTDTSILQNPNYQQIKSKDNLQLLYTLLANKAEALLLLFKESHNDHYIAKSVEAFNLTDFTINALRQSQTSITSQLFWRNRTRNFYRLAIEASYLANDPASILYFMEKSRAVLLNDKLNELGSLAYLPAAEAEQEQQLRINIASLEQQKETLSETDTVYSRVSQALLNAKEDFDRFIKTLETKFPVYYQYKYNVSVPSIQDIRDKLLAGGQNYLSFFETDSVVYALLISKSDVQFKKIPFPGYADTVKTFTQLCKDRQSLNAGYSRYAGLANMLYQKLVEPFNIPKGKIIVSPDLNFIPLDALVKDKAGKEFLVYDYAFDYTYSAGYLVKAMNNNTARTGGAGFLGIAPESFASNLSLTKLYGSVTSLESIFSKYGYGRLLKYSAATRHFFLNNAGTFSLMHLYAHAKSGADGEPVLYMNDSAVAVSELSQWDNPKVGLAFLAACETGAGELYIGEGINSIARSFAAIGVPSTIATLWKADNKAIYAISEKFYYYLSRGLSKDEALQRAKIDFVKQGPGENLLPYYWASAVLSGNANPVKLSSPNALKKYWFVPLIFALTAGVIYYRRKVVMTRQNAA